MDTWVAGVNGSSSGDVTTTTTHISGSGGGGVNQAASEMPLLWQVDYTVLTVMISSLSFMGIVGNIPVLIVYFRRKDKKASNTFIKILALVDLFVCAFIMPYTIVYEFHLIEADAICRTFELTRHFTILASNFTLIAIATERYIAVCHIGTKVRVSGINKGVLGIIIVSAVAAAPSTGTFAVVDASDVHDVECTFPHEVTSGRFCHFTYSVMGKLLVTAYQGFLVVIFFLVLIVIVVLYTVVYVVLWNKTKIRRKMNRNRDTVSVHLPVDFGLVPSSRNRDTVSVHLAADLGLVRDPQGLYSPPDAAAPMNVITEEDEDVKQQCHETQPYAQLDTVDGAEEIKTDAHVNGDAPCPNGNAQHIKSDIIVVSQDNNVVISKPLVKKKKNNVSFSSVDRPRKRRYYHRRTAKMLFMCTVIYFVTWVPFWIDVFGFTNSKVIRYLFFIGHASNPIVYGIVNEQVRRSFKRLVFSCFKRWCGKEKFISTGRENSINSTSGTEIKGNS